ncbi:MAG: hypothetical protein ABSA77_08900 [Thermoguttaceae bacterium]|jgi:hypothetical protein
MWDDKFHAFSLAQAFYAWNAEDDKFHAFSLAQAFYAWNAEDDKFHAFSLAQAFYAWVGENANLQSLFPIRPLQGPGDFNMGHAFHQLYYHFAWSTHSRVPLIHRSYRSDFLKIINE